MTKNKSKLTRSLIIVSMAATLWGGVASAPAFAATGPWAGATDAATSGPLIDQQCVEAIEKAAVQLSDDVCVYKETLETSAPEVVSVASLQSARGSMSTADFNSLVAAAAAGTVQTKTFTRTYDNVVVAWRQTGRFYYDGTRAWVTASYRGYQGYQTCKVDRTIGYAISIKKCDESGSTSTRNLRAIFTSNLIADKVPIGWDTEWHTYVNSTGKVWW